MNELRIKAALAWLKELEDHEYMLREIFDGSEDKEDWKMHDSNLMHIELVRNLILGATSKERDSTVSEATGQMNKLIPLIEGSTGEKT
jgi:hypothetical protein